jgi:hypothetical protein
VTCLVSGLKQQLDAPAASTPEVARDEFAAGGEAADGTMTLRMIPYTPAKPIRAQALIVLVSGRQPRTLRRC